MHWIVILDIPFRHSLLKTCHLVLTITERVVCVGSTQSPLQILDVETGQLLRMLELGDWRPLSSPVIADNTVYVGCWGYLKALDLETGEELWQFQTPEPDDWRLKPQFWLNEMVLRLLTVATGTTVRFEVFSSPVIADDVVYVNSSFGHLYALH